MISEIIKYILVISIGLIFYFTPTIAVWNKKNARTIITINILLGWTIVGWIAALVWALDEDKKNEDV